MILLLLFPALASAAVGIVVADHYKCEGEGSSDRIVIETNMGFTLAQVYSGYSATFEDRKIYGDLNSYGFKDVTNENGDEARIYIDDYMATEDSAREWCWGE